MNGATGAGDDCLDISLDNQVEAGIARSQGFPGPSNNSPDCVKSRAGGDLSLRACAD